MVGTDSFYAVEMNGIWMQSCNNVTELNEKIYEVHSLSGDQQLEALKDKITIENLSCISWIWFKSIVLKTMPKIHPIPQIIRITQITSITVHNPQKPIEKSHKQLNYLHEKTLKCTQIINNAIFNRLINQIIQKVKEIHLTHFFNWLMLCMQTNDKTIRRNEKCPNKKAF